MSRENDRSSEMCGSRVKGRRPEKGRCPEKGRSPEKGSSPEIARSPRQPQAAPGSQVTMF